MRFIDRVLLLTTVVITLAAPCRADQPPSAQPEKPSQDHSVEIEKLRQQLAPIFVPPKEFADDFGSYKSPLKFDDGRDVKTPGDWKLRRAEILKYWHGQMGPWPPLVEKPKIENLEKESHEGYTQQRIRVQVAPDRTSDDAYLLTPEGKGPFPAVIVVFYDGLSGLGAGRGAGRTIDFARQLVKRGFVALSFGSDPNTYYPSKDKAQLQPLSYNAYMAANLYNALATLPSVDAKRVGITGLSYGGKWAMFASCLDERFACAVWIDPDVVFDEKRSYANYYEPWYLGYQPDYERKKGLLSPESPRTGAYKQLVEAGHDLHELHTLMAPRPFLLSGGSEDKPDRWRALNHSVAVNKLLGDGNRVAMTTRADHSPTDADNETMAAFFEYFLKYGCK